MGLGSFYTSIPAGQTGPADTAGNPVTPQVTTDFSGPAPTNTWWSSLIWQRYPGAGFGQIMHAHPLSLKAESEGLQIGHASPSFPTGAGYGYHFTDPQHALTIGVQGLQASEVKVADASDWTVTAAWEDDVRSMRATFGRGLPTVRTQVTNGIAQQNSMPTSVFSRTSTTKFPDVGRSLCT